MKGIFFTLWFIGLGLSVAYADPAADTLAVLQRAYPEANLQYEQAEDGTFALLGGEKILIQPLGGCPQTSPDSLQLNVPLCAVFSQPYPLGTEGLAPVAGFDPGRIRNQTFLKALYGATRTEVKKNCVAVNFLGERVLFNRQHGAAAALARVALRLEAEVKANPRLKEYIFPTDGTFNWRTIQGTDRLSAHSFAIAIDLNTTKGLYWQWKPGPSPEHLAQARTSYPQSIIDAFEAEGFIWGGKWHAYDLMHFEYRPELIVN